MSNAKKILIAEDEGAMLEALVSKFEKSGFEVISAQDGEEGLVKALKEKPDILMLDIIMPKINGLELVKKIREDKWGTHVPIVLLTNLSDAYNISEAGKYGVYDFLVKTDWRLDDIVKLIKEKLNII
jgi:DNA-binding response OmpR family regulator